MRDKYWQNHSYMTSKYLINTKYDYSSENVNNYDCDIDDSQISDLPSTKAITRNEYFHLKPKADRLKTNNEDKGGYKYRHYENNVEIPPINLAKINKTEKNSPRSYYYEDTFQPSSDRHKTVYNGADFNFLNDKETEYWDDANTYNQETPTFEILYEYIDSDSVEFGPQHESEYEVSICNEDNSVKSIRKSLNFHKVDNDIEQKSSNTFDVYDQKYERERFENKTDSYSRQNRRFDISPNYNRQPIQEQSDLQTRSNHFKTVYEYKNDYKDQLEIEYKDIPLNVSNENMSRSYVDNGIDNSRLSTSITSKKAYQSIISLKEKKKQKERSTSWVSVKSFSNLSSSNSSFSSFSKIQLSREAKCNLTLEKYIKKLESSIQIHSSVRQNDNKWKYFIERLNELYKVSTKLRDIQCRAKVVPKFEENEFIIKNKDWANIDFLYQTQGELDNLENKFKDHPLYTEMVQKLKEITVEKLDEIWKSRSKKYALYE